MAERGLLPILACLVLVACERQDRAAEIAAAPSCSISEATTAVERFGERLEQVSLLAPDSLVLVAIREEYGPLVTEGLLESWLADPTLAPGREVSSPWPDMIEVTSVSEVEDGCAVEGEVVYVTSVEAARGGAASRVPVRLRVVNEEGWRVSAYQADPPDTDPPDTDPPDTPSMSTSTPGEATEVLRGYYAAIQAGDFRTAYDLWGDDGAATGQTFDEFAAGFAETARVGVEVGEPGRIEGAAGSRYVEIPVVVRAVLTDGTEQTFEGTYTLRRSVVDGASEEQRRWRIYSAEIGRTRSG